MGRHARGPRIAAAFFAVAGLVAGVASAACKNPLPPCSICDKSTQYCLVHLGAPNWDPQIVCKPMPSACTAGSPSGGPSCDCIIKADFLAAPPQCKTDSTGFTVTPNNDC